MLVRALILPKNDDGIIALSFVRVIFASFSCAPSFFSDVALTQQATGSNLGDISQLNFENLQKNIYKMFSCLTHFISLIVSLVYWSNYTVFSNKCIWKARKR